MNKKDMRLICLSIFFPFSILCDQEMMISDCKPSTISKSPPSSTSVVKKTAQKKPQRRTPKYKPVQDKNEKKVPLSSPESAPAQPQPIEKKTEITQSRSISPEIAVTKEAKKPAPRRSSKYKSVSEKNEKKAPLTPPGSAPEKSTKPGKEKIQTATAKKIETGQSRTISLKNALTKEMITYSHWSGDYTPEFKIMAKGTEIKPGTTEKIEIKNNKAEITYHYNFYNGYRKDTKKVELEIPDGSAFALDFSWKKQPNLSLVSLETKEVPAIKDSTSSNSDVKTNILLKE